MPCPVVLEPRSLKSGCLQGHAPTKRAKGSSFLPLPASGGSQHQSLAHPCGFPISTHTAHTSPCITILHLFSFTSKGTSQINSLHLQGTYFQIKPHLDALGVGISSCLCGRHKPTHKRSRWPHWSPPGTPSCLSSGLTAPTPSCQPTACGLHNVLCFSPLQATLFPLLTSTDSVSTTIHTEPSDIAPAPCDLRGACLSLIFPPQLSLTLRQEVNPKPLHVPPGPEKALSTRLTQTSTCRILQETAFRPHAFPTVSPKCQPHGRLLPHCLD